MNLWAIMFGAYSIIVGVLIVFFAPGAAADIGWLPLLVGIGIFIWGFYAEPPEDPLAEPMPLLPPFHCPHCGKVTSLDLDTCQHCGASLYSD